MLMMATSACNSTVATRLCLIRPAILMENGLSANHRATLIDKAKYTTLRHMCMPMTIAKNLLPTGMSTWTDKRCRGTATPSMEGGTDMHGVGDNSKKKACIWGRD